MVDENRRKEILTKLAEAVVEYDEEEAKRWSEIVAMSAMMTTTMMGMKKVIEMIKEKNPNVKIMLGGAPVTKTSQPCLVRTDILNQQATLSRKPSRWSAS
jgi:cobalamin-dependent methionine synthase I